METIKHSKDIEIHIKYLNLFKKVIESAIELEKNNNQTFGYIVSNSTDCDIYFGCDTKFMNLMNEHSIVLKSKLQYHQIYFPMFILSRIINHDIFDIDPVVLIERYTEYLEDNQLLEEGVDYDDDFECLNRMLQEKGDFWINRSGCSKNRQEYTKHIPENLIFNFDESFIERYFYEDERFVKKTRYINKNTGEIIRLVVEELEKSKAPSGEKKYFALKKENTKFYFGKKKIIEYTLQDILEYLNEQINVYHSLDSLKNLNKELDSEVKSPKMVQKLLDNGLSIDEALEQIGY